MVEFSLEGKSFSCGRAEPGLYIIATPIGNLSDISIRALKILAGADIVACEDTRNTGKLLRHFNIHTKMLPYHEHNSAICGPKIIKAITEGKSVALVSDAGTPLISDPGYKLVTAAQKKGLKIFPIPGASAPLAALVASGLETDSFMFLGFLPSKSAARQQKLQEFKDFTCTLIFFESPNRLLASLQDMARIFGNNRKAAVCRELTKLHEETCSSNLGLLTEEFAQRRIRGEIVVVIGSASKEEIIDVDALLGELLETLSVSRAAAEASKLCGKPKRELYQRALFLSEKQNGP